MPKAKQFNEGEVLQKARDVFWKQGYNGTSMDELVKATGLSRSSIYDTFGDKHGLYVKSLKYYSEAQTEKLLIELPSGLSSRKRINWFFQHHIDVSLTDPNRKGCFMLNSTTELANLDNSINQLAVDNMDQMEALFLSWIKEGQANGEISKRFKAKALSRHLFNCINGLKVIGQTKPDKSTLEDIVKVSLSVLD